MKEILFLLFCLLGFVGKCQGYQANNEVRKPFIEYKDGSRAPVAKPVVVCDSMCYYINRFDKKVYAEPVTLIHGFSDDADVRWMTKMQFRNFGVNPVHGYFWGAVFIYPTFFGVFILSDTVKRKHIQKMYKSLGKNF